MERLKTELLLLARQRGDKGSTEEHRWGIENYMEALSFYFTREGVESFSAEELRHPYVEYINAIIKTRDVEEARKTLMQFFHTRPFVRDTKPELHVSSTSVVDIFSRRS